METSEDQKERISECFKKHFNHFGFQKTSVDEVSKELKMSKKTIYRFFNTKEEIFYYVVSKIARQYSANMLKKTRDYDSAADRLEALIRMVFKESRKWVKENDAFAFKYKYEIADLAFQDAYREVFKVLLSEGLEKNEFHFKSVDITSQFIQGMIAEGMRMVTEDPRIDIEDELIASIQRLVNG